MKNALLVWSVPGLVIGTCFGAGAASGGSVVGPDEALLKLQTGNARFVAGKQQHTRQDFGRRDLTASQGQHPIVL